MSNLTKSSSIVTNWIKYFLDRNNISALETEQWKSEVLKKTSKPNIKFFVGKVKARKRIKIIIIEYKMTVLFEVHYGILPHYH